MLLKLKRTPGLYLVGFMGSGKSAVGRLLADELGWFFADIDEDIENAQGISIAEIFDTRGERGIPRNRAGSVAQTCSGSGVRQTHGAGLGRRRVCRSGESEAAGRARRHGMAGLSFPAHRARVDSQTHRPLARDPEKFQQLFDDRRDVYVKAEHRIEADTDDPAAIVAEILKLPIF